MQSWNLSLSSSKQPWMMSARDLDWSSLKSRLQVRCGGELGFGSWNDSWLSSFCSWSSCWRSAPAELNAAKTVKMTHFNWDDMIYKLQTTGLSLIWTMKMYENVWKCCFTNSMDYRRLSSSGTKLFTTHCPANQQPHLFRLKNVSDHHKTMLALVSCRELPWPAEGFHGCPSLGDVTVNIVNWNHEQQQNWEKVTMNWDAPICWCWSPQA